MLSTVLYKDKFTLPRESKCFYNTLGVHISQKSSCKIQCQIPNKHLAAWCNLLFSSALCFHTPLSTLTEEIVLVFRIRTACTSANRKHNSVLMCDNLVICFLELALSQHLIYGTNYWRCVESDFPSVCIIIKQLLKLVFMFWVKILI